MMPKGGVSSVRRIDRGSDFVEEAEVLVSWCPVVGFIDLWGRIKEAAMNVVSE